MRKERMIYKIHAPQCACGGQRSACRSWVPGIGVRSQDGLNHLVGSTVLYIYCFMLFFETEFHIVQDNLEPGSSCFASQCRNTGIQPLPGLGDGM